MRKQYSFILSAVLIALSLGNYVWGQTTTIISTASGSWICPPGVTSATVECTGGGGSGGGTSTDNQFGGGGGAGGAYARKVVTVTPLTTYSVNVAATKTGTTGAGAQGNSPGSVQ